MGVEQIMSEERLQEIKDSVNFQREILKAHNMETLCVDEEQELIEEIERLNNIINKLEEVLNENVELTYVHYGRRQYNKTLTEGELLFRDYIKSKLQELKGSDSNVKK